jgi:CRP-like cAMP-binding protein
LYSGITYDFDHMPNPLEHLIEHLPVDARRKFVLAKGEFLFRQQQPATAIFAVVSGRIRLFRDLPDGSSVILHVARSGETFAEASLFAEHYHCHAQADLDTTVMRINALHLLSAISTNNELGMQFSRILAAQVREMRTMLSLRDIRSADERLLAWLRLKAKGEQMRVIIDRPWTGVSEELGLTREAVYRALAHLQQQGFIERHGRQDRVQAETIHLLKR